MPSSTEASVLKVLERAELAARERRLAASTEAERIMSAAREQATAITARTAARVTDAIEGLRTRTEREAERAIRALEHEAHARDLSESPPTDTDPAVKRAVVLVVAAILGEPDIPRGEAGAILGGPGAPLAGASTSRPNPAAPEREAVP